MVEDWIEKFEAISRRQKLTMAAALLVMLVILGVGLNTIVAGFLKGHRFSFGASKKPLTVVKVQKTSANESDNFQAINDASFTYLVPASSSAWTLDSQSEGYDSTKSVVTYDLKLNNANTTVTITQQAMPASLLPLESPAYTAFISSEKPSSSVESAQGTLYFLAALENGVPAEGSTDTIIYATNGVLMFGRAGQVVSYEAWTKIIDSMKAGS